MERRDKNLLGKQNKVASISGRHLGYFRDCNVVLWSGFL